MSNSSVVYNKCIPVVWLLWSVSQLFEINGEYPSTGEYGEYHSSLVYMESIKVVLCLWTVTAIWRHKGLWAIVSTAECKQYSWGMSACLFICLSPVTLQNVRIPGLTTKQGGYRSKRPKRVDISFRGLHYCISWGPHIPVTSGCSFLLNPQDH